VSGALFLVNTKRVLVFSATPSRGKRHLHLVVAAIAVAVVVALLGVPAGAAEQASSAPVQAAPAAAERKGCSFSSRGLPRCGAFLGQTYGANTDPRRVEKNLGRRLGVRRTFFRADQVDWAIDIARADIRKGRLPWMSFKLPRSWGEMAAGAGDAWARNLAARFGRLNGPVWLAFHHEPEGDGAMGDWRRMQEHLTPIVRAHRNLAMTVIVTGWHQFYGESKYRLRNIWPRRVNIDVAGFDIYNQLGVVKDGEENTDGTNLQTDYFRKIAPWAKRQDVAWGLAETGITHKAARRHPHWIKETHRRLARAGGVAMAYFNTTLNSIAEWQLSTRPKRVGYREAQPGTPLLPR
jgi:hypothetical protein